MQADELLALYRREMRDTAVPYLVDDADLYTYMSDAQRMFCRLTDGLEDAITEKVTQIEITTGEEWVPLSPVVLKVRSAHRADTGEPVRIVDAEDIDAMGMRFDGRPGRLRALVSGFERGKLRVWPMPDATVVVKLAVFRLPLRDVSADQTAFEIREEHHLALLDWMKHKVYSVPDAELYDRRRAELHEEKFRMYCMSAKREQGRLRHAAGTVQYGGL